MKYCKNCGAELADEAIACPQCGQPCEKGKQNVFGIIGFVASLLVMFVSFGSTTVSGIIWLAGLVFSIVGIVQAKKKNQKKSFAVAGLVLSLVGIVLILLLLLFLGGLIAGMGGALAALALL